MSQGSCRVLGSTPQRATSQNGDAVHSGVPLNTSVLNAKAHYELTAEPLTYAMAFTGGFQTPKLRPMFLCVV